MQIVYYKKLRESKLINVNVLLWLNLYIYIIRAGFTNVNWVDRIFQFSKFSRVIGQLTFFMKPEITI